MRSGIAEETRTPEAIEGDRVAWQQRKGQLAEDLTEAAERHAMLKATLGDLVTSPNPDDRALKHSRAQRLAVVVEIEEIEAGLAAAERHLLDLEAERRAAEQRIREHEAVGLIDAALAAARDLDAAWTPALERLRALLDAHQAAAVALGRLQPGRLYQLDERSMARILLHRVPSLVPLLGFADVSERVSVEEFLVRHYARARQDLLGGGAS